MLVEVEPPDRMQEKCREAVRCYVLGFHGASVALVRSTVENAIKRVLVTDIDYAKLKLLNRRAHRAGHYSTSVKKGIDSLAGLGDELMHHAAPVVNLQAIRWTQTALQAVDNQSSKR